MGRAKAVTKKFKKALKSEYGKPKAVSQTALQEAKAPTIRETPFTDAEMAGNSGKMTLDDSLSEISSYSAKSMGISSNTLRSENAFAGMASEADYNHLIGAEQKIQRARGRKRKGAQNITNSGFDFGDRKRQALNFDIEGTAASNNYIQGNLTKGVTLDSNPLFPMSFAEQANRVGAKLADNYFSPNANILKRWQKDIDGVNRAYRSLQREKAEKLDSLVDYANSGAVGTKGQYSPQSNAKQNSSLRGAASYAVGGIVLGSLVLNMCNSRGQQTNAQLYGQVPIGY